MTIRTFTKIPSYATLSLLCLMLSSHALASQTSVVRLSTDTVAAQLLSEVIVKAYGRRQNLLQLPVSVGIVSSGDIRTAAATGLPGLVNAVPGVYGHQGTLNTNRITIRGIGARIPYATGRIRSAIDEVPLTNGSGYSMVEYIDPAFIDHIEVFKSPSTPAHGASLGGTIHLNSLDENLRTHSASYRITAGSFDWLNHNLRMTHRGKKALGKILFSNTSATGWRENNSHNGYFGGYSGRMMPNNNTTISLLFVWQQMKAYIPSSIDSATFTLNPRAAAANWKKTQGYESGKRIISGFTIEQALPAETTIKATIYGHALTEEELRPFDHFGERRQLGGARLELGRSIRMHQRQLQVSTGMESYVESVAFGNVSNVDGQGTLGDSISRNNELIRSLALFAQAAYKGSGTTINAGMYMQQLRNRFTNRSFQSGRVVSDQYQPGWTLSPRLAVSRQLSKNAFAYTSYSHGFAPPSLQETLDTQGMLNPSIRPETSHTVDLGLRVMTHRANLFADLTLFYMQISNLLVAERIDADRWVGRNAGKASHKGLEALVMWDFDPIPFLWLTHLRAKNRITAGDYRFVEFIDRGTDHSGKQVPGIPGITAGISLEARTKKGFELQAAIELVGAMAMNDSNTQYSEPYTLLHLSVGWSGVVRKLNVSLAGQLLNATNTQYASMILVNAPGQRNQRWYYPGQPIHSRLSLMIGLGN